MVKRLAHECKRADIETEGISDTNEFAPIVSTAAVDFYVLCPQMKEVQNCYQDGLSYRIHVMSEKASSELNGDDTQLHLAWIPEAKCTFAAGDLIKFAPEGGRR